MDAKVYDAPKKKGKIIFKLRRGEPQSLNFTISSLEGLRLDGQYGYRVYRVPGGYILRKPPKRG